MINQTQIIDFFDKIFNDYSSKILYKKYDAIVAFEFMMNLNINNCIQIPHQVKMNKLYKEMKAATVERRHFFKISSEVFN